MQSPVSIFFLLAISFVFAACLLGYLLVAAGLFPKTHRIASYLAANSLWISLAIGLVPYGIALALSLALLQPAPIIGVPLFLTLSLISLTGTSGIAATIGQRLAPEEIPWIQLRRGGTALLLFLALPIVGWFIFLPLAAATGFGIMLRRTFLSRSISTRIDNTENATTSPATPITDFTPAATPPQLAPLP
jgi:hypothetical protein